MQLRGKDSSPASAEDAGRTLAHRLLERGAAEFLAGLEAAPPAGNPRA